MRSVVVVLVVCLLGGLALAPAAAQSVDRPAEVSVAPGETAEVTIEVAADSGELNLFEETVITEEAPVTITDASNTAGIADPSIEDNGQSFALLYVDLSDPNATVASDTITYTVAVDADAEPGTTVVTEHELIANQTSVYGSTRFEIIDPDGDAPSDDSDPNDSDDTTDDDSGPPSDADTDDSGGATTAPDSDTPVDSVPATDDDSDGETTAGGDNASDPDPGSDLGAPATATSPSGATAGPATESPTTPARSGYAPGETVTVVFTVRNTGGAATAANLSLTTVPDAVTIVDERTRVLTDRLETLNSGTAIEVPYRVRIAPTASPGDYEIAATATFSGSDDTPHTATTSVTLSVTNATASTAGEEPSGRVSAGGLLAVGLVTTVLIVGGVWWRRRDR